MMVEKLLISYIGCEVIDFRYWLIIYRFPVGVQTILIFRAATDPWDWVACALPLDVPKKV